PLALSSGWRRYCAAAATPTGDAVGEFRRRIRVAEVKGGEDQGAAWVGKELTVRGWVRTCRAQRTVTFVEVNDGSCLSNMQCVLTPETEGYGQIDSINTGASVLVEGVVASSQGVKQKVELKVSKIIVIGESDPTSFPIQKKRASREFLRTVAHLRPRTNTFGAVARVRNALAYATHKFFQDSGFIWVSSPIITASDCEGAGEQFYVTTLLSNSAEGGCLVNSIPSKDGRVDWSQRISSANQHF
uniref:OB domain-containing protein n=1 Tax=Aegilops tauschii subsp. strangulata TaxID=200361 RepID=A0A453BIP1_AEGTS